MSYIVITVWESLIRTIYLYQTPAVFLMLVIVYYTIITTSILLSLASFPPLLCETLGCVTDIVLTWGEVNWGPVPQWEQPPPQDE